MSKTMNQILELGQDADKLHPLAVKHYQEFLDDISKHVPLGNISESDMKESLSELDYYNYESSIQSLTKWLSKCFLTNDSSTLKVYPDSFPFWGTYGFKDLLLKVYERKQYRQMVADAQNRAQSEAYQTEMRHARFINDVNKCLKESRNRLAGLKKPQFKCPEWLRGYNPKTWCARIAVSSDWLSSKLDPLVAQERRNFPEVIRHTICCGNDYDIFFIPRATYERVSAKSIRKGIPVSGPSVACLHWWVEIYVIAIADIYLRNGIVNLTYDTGVMKQLRCRFENLGKVYAEPEFWKSQWVFYTPLLVLLSALGEALRTKMSK